MNPNIFDLLKNFNLDDLKKKGEEAMAQLREERATGVAGGGFVSVTLNGEFQVLSIDFEESDIIKEDLSMFRDLIIAAHNDAAVKMRDIIKSKFSSSMIPGMFQ
jgi:DNA-binding YbaB/EbfC family protein